MSTIDPIASSSTAPAPTTPAAQPTLKDQFMRLFIAQLQNQDPLSPQDSSAFVAQLAQLSQLEQSTETNTHLKDLADGQAATARAQLTNLVGHKVTATADTIDVRAGAPPIGPGGPTVTVHLDGAAAQTKLVVNDAGGHAVRTIDLGARNAGDVTVDWGAKAGDLAAGRYTLAIDAKASDGSAVTGSTQISGVIDAMQIDETGGRFRIGPFTVAPAAVTAVGAL